MELGEFVRRTLLEILRSASEAQNELSSEKPCGEIQGEALVAKVNPRNRLKKLCHSLPLPQEIPM
jgi:hypothetical protein